MGNCKTPGCSRPKVLYKTIIIEIFKISEAYDD